MKWILHDWDDRRAEAILANCRNALVPDGRLLIIEQVLPDPGAVDGQRDPTFADLGMLVLYGGKERTRADFDALCERSGLSIERIVPATPPLGVSVIEVSAA